MSPTGVYRPTGGTYLWPEGAKGAPQGDFREGICRYLGFQQGAQHQLQHEVSARDKVEGGEPRGAATVKHFHPSLLQKACRLPRACVCLNDINVKLAFSGSEERSLQLEMDHQSSRELCSTRLSMFAEEIWIMLLSCMTFTICVTLSVTKMPFFKWFSHYGIQPLIMMYVSDSILFL